jgi:hypothetical protein
VSKLSVVNFYFSLRCSKPKPQNHERMKHAASCSQKLGLLSHCLGSYWVGEREGELCGLGSCEGGVRRGDGGGLLAFSRFVAKTCQIAKNLA